MSDKTDRTFVDCVLAGDALDTDVDAFVETWHDSNDRRSLPQYLGLSDAEYGLWVEQPDTLRPILHAKRHDLSSNDMLDWDEAHLLAARSLTEQDSASLIDWLRKKGFIG